MISLKDVHFRKAQPPTSVRLRGSSDLAQGRARFEGGEPPETGCCWQDVRMCTLKSAVGNVNLPALTSSKVSAWSLPRKGMMPDSLNARIGHNVGLQAMISI